MFELTELLQGRLHEITQPGVVLKLHEAFTELIDVVTELTRGTPKDSFGKLAIADFFACLSQALRTVVVPQWMTFASLVEAALQDTPYIISHNT